MLYIISFILVLFICLIPDPVELVVEITQPVDLSERMLRSLIFPTFHYYIDYCLRHLKPNNFCIISYKWHL